MASKVLRLSWLVSPVILGGAMLAASGALAQDGAFVEKVALGVSEVPQETVTATSLSDEPALRADSFRIDDAPNVAIATTEPIIAANPEKSKLENLAPVEAEASVPLGHLPKGDRDASVLEKLDRYSNENEANSLGSVNNLSQVGNVSPKDGERPNADLIEQINEYSNSSESDPLDQVTNVTQLRDVSPGDWAFEALRSLVERYGCIAGYPDGTYRGNRSTSRYEFAAGVNACLQQIERIITTGGEGFASRKDLETLQRLVNEFRTELTALGARVDKLEGRTAFLEEHQFSTTTKLSGEAIFALTDEFLQPLNNNTVFQDRVRLTFNTSFTGQDRLVTRLAAGNANVFSNSAGGSLFEGQQTFNIGNTGNNNVALDWLAYYFNFGNSKVYLAATGGIHSDYAPTLNP